MNSEKINNIFEAIKTDNLKLFGSLIESKSDLNYCYGRFPILSLCYLYKSYSILNQYEDTLINVKTYTLVDEHYEMYLEFKKYAKKSLRLYLNGEIVVPVEMLAIIDDRELIAKNYQKYQNNYRNVSKIRKIYSITHSTEVDISKEMFHAPRVKRVFESKLILSVVSVILCFMMIFPTFSLIFVKANFGLGTAGSPISIRNESDFVNAANKGSMTYVLQDDIYLTESINVESFKGTINGNNKTVYLDYEFSKALFKNFSGVIENLKIMIAIENLKITDNLAIFAQNLSGKIKNCEIYGTIDAEFNNVDDAYFSMFAYQSTKDAVIENSKVTVSAIVTNSASKNSYITGFCGINNGKIINCKTVSTEDDLMGLFDGETVDMAGFAGDNNGTIEGCENNLKINQVSASNAWNPNSSGFVFNNNGIISNCTNNGNIIASSTNELPLEEVTSYLVVYAAGFAISNAGTISNCINNGQVITNSVMCWNYSAGVVVANSSRVENTTNNGHIIANSQRFYISIAGIVCENSFTSERAPEGAYDILKSVGTIDNCKNTGKIEAKSIEEVDDKNLQIYMGGISAFNYTSITNSENAGELFVYGKSSYVYAGGIVGVIDNSKSELLKCNITNCKSSGDGTVGGKVVYAGGLGGYSKYAPINDSVSRMSLSLESNEIYSGGLFGITISATISGSNFKGELKNYGNIVHSGGLVGFSNAGTLKLCYVQSNITSADYPYNEPNPEKPITKATYVSQLVGLYRNNNLLSDAIYCTDCSYVTSSNKILFWFDNQTRYSAPFELDKLEGVKAYNTFEEVENAYK